VDNVFRRNISLGDLSIEFLKIHLLDLLDVDA
jgi:hypothetical protein